VKKIIPFVIAFAAAFGITLWWTDKGVSRAIKTAWH
jgi:prepilin signal peptidase PulO-like enzyme (type II secretory pathway)